MIMRDWGCRLVRIQLSLTINNPEVYEFCSHLKEARELNSLVLRLLTAYMQDEEGVFNSVGGDIDTSPPEQKDFSSEYDSIRESLQVLDILSQDAENLFSDSSTDFEEYMDAALNKGVVKETTTETGDSIVAPNIDLLAKGGRKEKPADMFDFDFVKEMLLKINKSMSDVRSDVNNLKKYVKYPEGADLESASTEETGFEGMFEDKGVTPPVTHEETIDSGTGAVSDEMDFGEEPTYEFDSDSGEVEFNPQEDEQLEASEPKHADASKAIGDLLGSLMG